jgi:hypothetical protein
VYLRLALGGEPTFTPTNLYIWQFAKDSCNQSLGRQDALSGAEPRPLLLILLSTEILAALTSHLLQITANDL